MINPTSKCDYHLYPEHPNQRRSVNIMISLLTQNFNNNSIQSDYDRLLNDKLLICPSCGCHNLTYHGSYIRNFSLFSENHTISIRRYRCAMCRVTHAIIPIYIIPFHLYNHYFENLFYHLEDKYSDLIRFCFKAKRCFSYGFT